MQRRSESSELNAKHHIGTVRVERRQAELEQTDQSLQIVIRTAIVAAEREELLSSPVFYSTEQPPLKFDLDGKVIVHPRVVLAIQELEQATIRADVSQKKHEEELKRKKRENLALKAKLKKASELLAVTDAATPRHLDDDCSGVSLATPRMLGDDRNDSSLTTPGGYFRMLHEKGKDYFDTTH